MSSPLAIHGGPPVVRSAAPQVPWPPVDINTAVAVTAQLYSAVSLPGRTGIVAELESRLAEFFGVRRAVVTSSGTAALHSAYSALGLTDGDEVIVPAYTAHPTATPLFHLRAKPVLVDCDELGNIDPLQVEAAITPFTKAIVVTHLWGVPARVEALADIAERHGIRLVEDGSHAHGAAVGGRRVGTFGHIAAFSTGGAKPLSAGEGGFVLTDDDDLYYRVLLHSQDGGRCRSEIPIDHPLRRYVVTGTGLAHRMHPLAAALALGQLNELDRRLGGRRQLAAHMISELRGLPGISVPEVPARSAPAWYALALLHRPEDLGGLPVDALIAALRAEGCLEVDHPRAPRPLNEHPLFDAPNRLFPNLPEGWPRYRAGQYPRAERRHRNTLTITVPHDDPDLAEGYVRAFRKVIAHHRALIGPDP
ncbi:aminotransferase class I/II-fold pyridoxal phosphate-dependent enzyme [Saccharopolyspora sp. NFXS83]|uniref:DegT/DnrJ/EryC1/StrS family aminotransferase n=1 Tax=Saccharopolyspora sp. NFXS83 TaxID=2993560 RepID=UPI00224ABC89|nr:aminotransferase class I/II-fold pyridoxal phosphate-dependent enzyme [Saccharopolyspora sp. NFXS83]MCX2731813.1 aminotransferase class I/II-fold pyridoxal phosphate-dependent enzyme [Saccharopolyspora sp. NFXS83]